jgi:hypothetical protein
MMSNMLRRGEDLARAEQQRQIALIVARVEELLRGASVQAEDARVIVSGRGLLKLWLVDPSLRSLSGGLK